MHVRVTTWPRVFCRFVLGQWLTVSDPLPWNRPVSALRGFGRRNAWGLTANTCSKISPTWPIVLSSHVYLNTGVHASYLLFLSFTPLRCGPPLPLHLGSLVPVSASCCARWESRTTSQKETNRDEHDQRSTGSTYKRYIRAVKALTKWSHFMSSLILLLCKYEYVVM